MVEVAGARAGELEDEREAVVVLLTSRYAGPPWGESTEEIAAEAADLTAQVGRRGVLTAVARRHGVIVGLAQGGLGTTFLDDLAAARPGADLRTWGPPAFELRQLLVAPDVAGERVGSRLHDEVMRRVTAPALLLTHPEATGALRLYQRRGWELLVHVDVAPGHPRALLGLGVRHPASDRGGSRAP